LVNIACKHAKIAILLYSILKKQKISSCKIGYLHNASKPMKLCSSNTISQVEKFYGVEK